MPAEGPAEENADVISTEEDSDEDAEVAGSYDTSAQYGSAVLEDEDEITGGTYTATEEDESSTWELTGDSFITEFDGDLSRVITNGYHLYVNGECVL